MRKLRFDGRKGWKALLLAVVAEACVLAAPTPAAAGGLPQAVEETRSPARGAIVPVPDRPRYPEDDLPRAVLFAQIDSLRILYRKAEGDRRARLATAIARRLLATNLIKQHRPALDLLEEASRISPALYEAKHLQAATAAAMHYDRQARRWYEDLCHDFPDDPASWRLLGDFLFLRARRTLDESGLIAAASAYRRAVTADRGDGESKLRLAATLVALGRHDEAISVLDELAGEADWATAALLLRGCAYTAKEEESLAWEDFHQALATADSSLWEVFFYGRSFFEESRAIEDHAARLDPALLTAALHRVDPKWREEDGLKVRKALRDSTVLRKAVEAYWRSRNPWPTHLSNLSELRYWRRLVEAELLFGQPELGRRGWDRAPGRAWVVWGRPQITLYLAPSGGSRSDDLTSFLFEPGTLLPPSSVGVWAWDYRSGRGHFSLLFEDTVMNGNWLAHDSTARYLRTAQRQHPVLLLPAHESELAYRLELSTAAFHRPRGATTLESYILVQLTENTQDVEDDGFELEWSIFDARQGRLEYEKMSLGKQSRLDLLRREMGLPPEEGDEKSWLAVIPADLPPGRYRVAVDLHGKNDEGHLSRQLRLIIPRREKGELGVSDLELASTFHPLKGEEQVLAALVKHAFGILPVVGGIFPSSARQLYVYYEVYNLGRGKDGTTRFDVSYRIYRRKDKDHRWILRRKDVAGLSPVDPLGLHYLRESTDLSGQGHVVKGGTLDISGLGPGRYVLEVLIQDRVSGKNARSWANFSKSVIAGAGEPGAGDRSP